MDSGASWTTVHGVTESWTLSARARMHGSVTPVHREGEGLAFTPSSPRVSPGGPLAFLTA